jgi:hypothetical protein
MNLRRYFHSVFAVLSLMAHFTFYTPLYAQAPFPLQITEEDLKKAEAEIEAFRASLSAEERAKFDNDVAELTKALENMSEKELEEFFTQLVAMDQEMAGQMPTEIPQPVAEPVMPLPQPEPVKPEPVKKGDTRPAEQLIDSIVARINSFILKTKTIQDFDRKLISWQREGKIRKNGEIISWNDLQNAVNQFTQKLLKLKDKDPKTKELRYLFDLIEDKALYEKLSELNSELTNLEPNIIVSPTPGPQQVNKNAKTFIRKVIDTLTKTLYVDKLGDSIDKIIEKYEPTAKKLKEQEERKEQQALEASKRARQPEAAKTVGKAPSEPTPYQAPDYGTGFGGGFGAAPSGYIPSAPSGGGYAAGPSFMADIPAPSATPSSTPPTPATAPTTPSIPSVVPTDTKAAAIEGQKTEDTSKLAEVPQPSKEKTELSYEMHRNIETLEKVTNKINKSTEKIVETFKLPDVKQFASQLTAPTVNLGLAKRIVQVGEELEKMKNQLDTIEKGIKNIPEKNQSDVKKKFKTIFDDLTTEGRDFYNELRTAKIDQKGEWPKADTPDAVKYAYFADKSVKPSPELETLKETANIIQLKKDFDEVIQKLQKLIP